MQGQAWLSFRPLIQRHLLHRHLSLVPAIALLFALSTGIAACSSGASQAASAPAAGKVEHSYTMASVAQNKGAAMPSFVTADVRDGYEYALAHPDQLQYIPCYCGCGLNAGHKSNLECYISGVDKNGAVVFDNHASGCDICLEITRDVKRLSAEGKSLKDIRAYIDQTHGQKGPGTDTPQQPSS